MDKKLEFDESHERFLTKFKKQDPLNPQNTIEGLINRSKGLLGGSLIITKVNDKDVGRQVIYATPKLDYPYQDVSSTDYKSLPENTERIHIADKWNGTNILFYKYSDDKGNVFVTGKTKGTAVLSNPAPQGDLVYPKFLNLTQEALEKPTPLGVLGKEILENFKKSEFQSISFELFGKKEPHLVCYEQDIALMPLFTSGYDGSIKPYPIKLDRYMTVDVGTQDCKYLKKEDILNNVISICQEVQREDRKINDDWRKERKLPLKYEYEHFKYEGRVLYCLDKEGSVIDRTIYKLKPSDTEEVHWSKFDETMKGRVQEAIKKIHEREMPLDQKNLMEELDMGKKEWSRFGDDIMGYIASPKAKERKKVFMMIGLPGSGKTTAAKILEKSNKNIKRISKDEVGNVKESIDIMKNELAQGNSVIFDKCNQVKMDRDGIIQIAKEFDADVHFIILDTPIDECVKRAERRKDHENLPPEKAKIVIEDIANSYEKVSQEDAEKGIDFIDVIKNPQEASTLVKKYELENLTKKAGLVFPHHLMAAVLNHESIEKIKGLPITLKNDDPMKTCHHTTLWFHKEAKISSGFVEKHPSEKDVVVKPLGIIRDDKCETLLVSVGDELYQCGGNNRLHITLALADNIPPSYSNHLIRSKMKDGKIQDIENVDIGDLSAKIEYK